MPGSGVDISVIIVNYNTRDLLLACLRSIFETTPGLDVEVIVIDNASKDGSCEAVRAEFPQVNVVAHDTNTGISAATNEGIRASSGRYVLSLNPDTVVHERALQTMVALLESEPRIGACGCRLEYPDGRLQPSAFPLPSVIGAFRQYSTLFERLPWLAPALGTGGVRKPEESHPVGYCHGACMLVSRECLIEVGPMDEDFFLYANEVDWCRRIWEAGWSVFYCADATVTHHEGASTANDVVRRLLDHHGVIRYLRKWHGPVYVGLYETAVWICSAYHYSHTAARRLLGRSTDRIAGRGTTFFKAILTRRIDPEDYAAERSVSETIPRPRQEDA